MSRHKHYHIPDREARRAAQLERKGPVHRQTDIAESREELLALPRSARGYAPHQGAAEKARRVRHISAQHSHQFRASDPVVALTSGGIEGAA